MDAPATLLGLCHPTLGCHSYQPWHGYLSCPNGFKIGLLRKRKRRSRDTRDFWHAYLIKYKVRHPIFILINSRTLESLTLIITATPYPASYVLLLKGHFFFFFFFVSLKSIDILIITLHRQCLFITIDILPHSFVSRHFLHPTPFIWIRFSFLLNAMLYWLPFNGPIRPLRQWSARGELFGPCQMSSFTLIV